MSDRLNELRKAERFFRTFALGPAPTADLLWTKEQRAQAFSALLDVAEAAQAVTDEWYRNQRVDFVPLNDALDKLNGGDRG